MFPSDVAQKRHVFERCGPIGNDLTFQTRHVFERCSPIDREGFELQWTTDRAGGRHGRKKTRHHRFFQCQKSFDAMEVPAAPVDGDFGEAALLDAGIPESEVAKIQEVWSAIGEEVKAKLALDASAALMLLAEPMMLLRFLRAREGDVEKTILMWRATIEWRSLRIPRGLAECGTFQSEEEETVSSLSSEDKKTFRWRWRMHPSPTSAPSVRATLGLKHAHSRRIEGAFASDGGPLCVWRIGQFDLAGVVREKIEDAVAMHQVMHLEDALECAREVSLREKRLVRARVIVDLDGIALATAIKNIGLVKRLMGLSKAFFPEVTASVTFINAPWGFQSLWKMVSLLLNDLMRAKVLIVAKDYKDALKKHTLVDDLAILPALFGGKQPDSVLPPTLPVPHGAGKALKNDPSPSFLDNTDTYDDNATNSPTKIASQSAPVATAAPHHPPKTGTTR